MSLAGNLQTVSFPDILQLLSTGKKTGVLEVKTSTRQKEVAFKDGNIIFASSLNASEDLLGSMLLRRGRISKSDLERAITLHKQTGRQLGTTLIDMNLFDKQEITECLKLQIEEIVYNLFAWQDGSFNFHEDAAPKNAPFLLEMPTMSVIMEGTRRIDEWLEIQKVVPPDDVMLALASSPKVPGDEIVLTVEEFKVLALINGQRTLPELIDVSPFGEFVTCRAAYKLILNSLIEAVGKKENDEVEQEDEEVAVLSIIFHLYSHCFHRIRTVVESVVGETNTQFSSFAARYRDGLLAYFPGVDPSSDLMPDLERFTAAVQAVPQPIRMHRLMSGLDQMLAGQLEYVYMMLGTAPFREAVGKVKREIAGPLATRRDLVKRYDIEDSFYRTLKQTDKVVKMVRG